MDGSVLALFDPIYGDKLPQEISRAASASMSGHNMVSGSSPTPNVQGDASIASHQPSQVMRPPPSNLLDASTPSQSERIMGRNLRTHSQGTMCSSSSQLSSARSKPNPFGSRRFPAITAATVSRQSDRNMGFRTSGLPYQHHLLTARSVSLPTKLTNHDRFAHIAGRPRVVLHGAVHTNRVVSLPEAETAALNNHLPGAIHSRFSTLPTVDELQPLIDLASPPRQTLVDHATSQSAVPATALPAHPSLPSPPENGPSPTSSPESELSETDILVGSPTTGRSINFLRHRHGQAPSTTTAPDATTPTIMQTESQANPSTAIDAPTAKPIPALHGPPSLPYARCPSGAEGIMISEQASLPRMIWGLHELPPVAPKTPGVRRALSVEQQSENHPASELPQDTAAANTPASTVVVTPESVRFDTVWQHPKLSYTSSAPYTKFKRSMQTGFGVAQLQSANIDLLPHNDRHVKLRPSFSGQENAPLGSPFLLGEEQFETPGGYTEYRYVNEDDSNPLWQEFVPPSHHEVPEHLPLASHNLAAAPSLKSTPPSVCHMPNETDPNLASEENLNIPQAQAADAVKTPGLGQSISISSGAGLAYGPRTSSVPNSSDLTNAPPIFAVRKAPRSQPHRPKLRDHPALAELLSNPLFPTGPGRPAVPEKPLSPDIRELALSLGVAPEALADSLQKLRTRKFTDPAVHSNNSHPFTSIASHGSDTGINSLELPASPPGIKIPEHLLIEPSETRVAISATPFSARDATPAHPSGVLRNPRSIPLARLRNKNQHKFGRGTESTESSTPLPTVNDLEAGLLSAPIAKVTPNIQERENGAEAGSVAHDIAGGRVVMGAGIQAQGPRMLSGFATKSKKHSTAVEDAPKQEGSPAIDVAQTSLLKRSNRASASTARSRPSKESGSVRSGGARNDFNSSIARHGRPKKAGSRPRIKANCTNEKSAAQSAPTHTMQGPDVVPAS